jgi:hypothetical protein
LQLPESAPVLRNNAVIAGLLASLVGPIAAVACGSEDERRRLPPTSGGASGEGGQAPNGGRESEPGGQPTSRGGEGGVAAEPGPTGGGGVATAAAGEANAGGAAGGASPSVSTFGCFIRSGDGGDRLASGEPAVTVTSSVYSPACDAAWISDNADAFSPAQTPTTLVIRRTFVVDSSLSGAQFSITFEADDAVEFVLNGQSVATCAPPADNLALCQQGCTSVPIPAGALEPAGEVNTLEARLTNVQSAPVGDSWGYTALNYSVCVAAE